MRTACPANGPDYGGANGGTSRVIKGVSIDSRTVKKGDLFIAIKGKRFDGHRFVKEAIRRGALGVVVEKSVRNQIPKGDCPYFYVKDTVRALGQLARSHRDQFDIPVIAITGSAGKTTTKEMVAAVLKSRFHVLKNTGTENNHIGVALTLLKLRSAHDVVVVELGTNRFGDIRWLTYVANPTVALLTNIGESHLELLKSPRQVFREKSALVKGMAKEGTVILNKDDCFLRTLLSRKTQQRMISFGIEKRCDYQAKGLKVNKNHTLQFKVNRSRSMSIPTPVTANVYNLLAALSTGRLFRVPYADMAKAMKRFRFNEGRQAIKKVHGFWLIDDTYNANPVSLRSALGTLSSFNKGQGRRILVCADMLELGSRSKDLHRSMGRLAADSGVDLILTYGKFSEGVSRAAHLKNPGIPVFHSSRLSGIHKKLLSFCRPGDTILVKGSRGMRMERTIHFLGKKFH